MKRYSDEELAIMAKDVESDMVERKQSWGGDVPTKARQAICAFANDLPNHREAGVLMIGLDDDGNGVGTAIDDRLLQTLADIKTDGRILPLPAMTVEKRQVDDSDIAVVTVVPCNVPPVKFDGRIWIRTGPRRAIANEQEERILIERRRHRAVPYDLSPIYRAKIGDLSRAVFEDEYLPRAFAPDILEANHRTYEERLASCRMIVSPEDTTPTFLGVLTLGKNVTEYIPGAYVLFLRLAGDKLSDEVVDAIEIRGHIQKVINATLDKFNAYNRNAYDITTAPTHKITSDYSMVALEQLFYNAVMHRNYEGTNAPTRVEWYNDRVEIISPGGAYGNITPENFGKPGLVEYRNLYIADTMKNLGYVQSFGRGIYIARADCLQKGKPAPEFEVDESLVRCILRSA
ncbi:MAG: putative DNA binding domain-containing protein [Lachnospiraceae bacterium]|nr:putative DNA binding domain-containing protein [Lachnospiraceae bacterium]